MALVEAAARTKAAVAADSDVVAAEPLAELRAAAKGAASRDDSGPEKTRVRAVLAGPCALRVEAQAFAAGENLS